MTYHSLSETKMKAGAIVALTQCPAGWQNDEKWDWTHISGLYTLVEFLPREPANYVATDTWVVTDLDTGRREFHIDAWDLLEQVDPKAFGIVFRQEREAEIAAAEMEGVL